jgi:hypothetical protein
MLSFMFDRKGGDGMARKTRKPPETDTIAEKIWLPPLALLTISAISGFVGSSLSGGDEKGVVGWDAPEWTGHREFEVISVWWSEEGGVSVSLRSQLAEWNKTAYYAIIGFAKEFNLELYIDET